MSPAKKRPLDVRPLLALCSLALATMVGCPGCPPPPKPQADVEGCIAPRNLDLGASCSDPEGENEPNGSLVLAHPPDSGVACASPASGLVGTLASEEDVDVFRTGFCGDSQADKVIAARIDTDLELCVFARCQYGTTVVHDCYQTTPGDSLPDLGSGVVRPMMNDSRGNGFRGCCRGGAGQVSAAVQCPSVPGKQAVEGFIWIDAGDKTLTCTRYAVTYQIQ